MISSCNVLPLTGGSLSEVISMLFIVIESLSIAEVVWAADTPTEVRDPGNCVPSAALVVILLSSPSSVGRVFVAYSVFKGTLVVLNPDGALGSIKVVNPSSVAKGIVGVVLLFCELLVSA